MSGRTVMVQGTMSSVGKSLIVAALCRIFNQDGLRVAPFKAQNMALNSYATRDGREVGRAQAMQADAAGIDVTVEMNPVLIKPEADSFAQIVVMGKPWARLAAGEYMNRRQELWGVVTSALDALREEYDVIVMEGAGSPVEINLRQGDLVNMAMAEYADAPVLLVGDIDRGGVFAQLLGTMMLLDEHERARVRGLIVNKFRGDIKLFEEGVKMLEERAGVPVLGVVPFMRDLRIADEDSVALDTPNPPPLRRGGSLTVVVVRLPHISNFDDFDPLRAEADVTVRFADRVDDLAEADLVILPGTKTTIADLKWMRERGIADKIRWLAEQGTPILGICGGYQMLGRGINDPLHAESDETQVNGLGLLDVLTTFEPEKQTVRAKACVVANEGLFAHARGLEISGYEIRMGRTEAAGSGSPLQPLQRVIARGDRKVDGFDGAISQDGWTVGTYFHGLFDNDALRHTVLKTLAARKNMTRAQGTGFDREIMYDRLAETVRAHLDMKAIYAMIG